jgi:hypothetical protein
MSLSYFDDSTDPKSTAGLTPEIEEYFTSNLPPSLPPIENFDHEEDESNSGQEDEDKQNDSNELYGEARKQQVRARVTDQEIYSKYLRDMEIITPINKKLYKAIMDIHSQAGMGNSQSSISANSGLGKPPMHRKTSSALSDGSNSSSQSPAFGKSANSPRPQPPLKKADLIRAEAERQREKQRVEKLYPMTQNIIKEIENSRNPRPKQLIQWLRAVDVIPAYTAMILGAIMRKLAEIDDVNLSIELFPYWMEAVEAMQKEIDALPKVVRKASKGSGSDKDSPKLPKSQKGSKSTPKGGGEKKKVFDFELPNSTYATGELCVKIKEEYKVEWMNTIKQFEIQLKKTVDPTYKPSWIRYQMREVEGVFPNTLYDIATHRAEITPWQVQLLGLLRDMSVLTARQPDEDGTNLGSDDDEFIEPNAGSPMALSSASSSLGELKFPRGLLVHSTTTSGKTTLTLFTLELYLKLGWSVVYLAPNELLAMQCASLLSQTCKPSLSLHTENLALHPANATVHIIVPGYQPENFSPGEKILVVLDECHVMNEEYYNNYHELVELLAPFCSACIALSATLPQVNAFQEQLQDIFKFPFQITGTQQRPVRMRLFDGNGESMHPWSRGNLKYVTGLAGPDLEESIGCLSLPRKEAVSKIFSDIVSSRKMHVCDSELDRLDTLTMDTYEDRLREMLVTEPELVKRCFPNNYEANLTIKHLYNTLKKVSQRGTVLVFTPDPYKVFVALSQKAYLDMMDTVPFWQEILVINREFVASLGKIINSKYLAALDKVNDLENRQVKVKDNTALSIVQTTKTQITKLHEERRLNLQNMYNQYKGNKYSKLILEQASIEPEAVSEDYQPYTHLQFGKYAALSRSGIRSLYSGMTDMQVRAVTNGLALLDDFSSLEERIAVMASLYNQHFGVLISGRSTLAMGVNVGVSSTVIYDPECIFHSNEVQQMSERSGRKGLDRMGYSLVIRKPELEKDESAE